MADWLNHLPGYGVCGALSVARKIGPDLLREQLLRQGVAAARDAT